VWIQKGPSEGFLYFSFKTDLSYGFGAVAELIKIGGFTFVPYKRKYLDIELTDNGGYEPNEIKFDLFDKRGDLFETLQ